MATFSGRFQYRSFCAQPGSATAKPQIAAPWAPPGELDVTTDASGKISGTLAFSAVAKLAVSGTFTPAAGTAPEGIELRGEGPGSSIYVLRGYFVAGGHKQIVGTVVSLQNDLAMQPAGATGPFILYSVEGG